MHNTATKIPSNRRVPCLFEALHERVLATRVTAAGDVIKVGRILG